MSLNRLAQSASPYLQQHQNNPVDWYPWEQQALDEAQKQDKLIFLSIGYSSCHWCHVMAHECFEDQEVADILNTSYISIKVDREERPDIDEAYMTALQLTRGHGGWPLTAILLPNQEPIFLATYLPKHDRPNTPGLISVLTQITTAYQGNQREQLKEIASEYTEMLNQPWQAADIPTTVASGTLNLDIDQAVQTIITDYDPENGGFGDAPKFPAYTTLSFLNLYSLTPNQNQSLQQQAYEVVTTTLLKMACGGLFDHVGGGFHRYSTDANWRLPHFEKMLVDNIFLARMYLQASTDPRSTQQQREFFSFIAQRTLDWMLKELKTEDGQLGTALNADSEGEEGKFYVWTTQQVSQILDDPAEFLDTFQLTDQGNFLDEATRQRTGANVLHARALYTHNPEIIQALQKLHQERNNRTKPSLDTKALTYLNALAQSLLPLGRGRPASEAHGDEDEMPSRGVGGKADGGGQGTKQITRHSQTTTLGFLQDYAATAIALAYQGHQDRAEKTTAQMVEKFFDKATGLFLTTSSDHFDKLGKRPGIMDTPEPSGNALAVQALLVTNQTHQAQCVLQNCAQWMQRAPSSTSALWEAYLQLQAQTTRTQSLQITQHVNHLQIDIPQGQTITGPDQRYGLKLTQNNQSLQATTYPNQAKLAGRILITYGDQKPDTLHLQICTDVECLPVQEFKLN